MFKSNKSERNGGTEMIILWFLVDKLEPSLLKFYSCHYDLVNHYGISVSQMTMDMFLLL